MAQNALITGVGRRRGIGAGIAAGLAADGWDLALSYWHPYDETPRTLDQKPARSPHRNWSGTTQIAAVSLLHLTGFGV